MSIASLLKRATTPEPDRPPSRGRRSRPRKDAAPATGAPGKLRRVLRLGGKAVLWFLAITVGWVLLYRFVPPPLTSLMAVRYIGAGPAHRKLVRDWTPYDKISKELALAVIASEDQRFLDHHGFDYADIRKAIEQSQQGERLRGASTISQQVAKNCFLWPSRSWVRKGFEVYFTVLVELLWSKQRILEMYLNVAEMGPGIYGAQSAAQTYFHKDAKAVTRAEAALLAATLPNPVYYSSAKPQPHVRARQEWILDQMGHLGGTSFLKSLED